MVTAAAKSLQSCPTLSDPTDCSLPGSSIHGIFQARVLEWGDYSHEMKRHLLLGRKAMINLDSILKSRDITLPTKVHLTKGMVLPEAMYEYESWAIKKVE